VGWDRNSIRDRGRVRASAAWCWSRVNLNYFDIFPHNIMVVVMVMPTQNMVFGTMNVTTDMIGCTMKTMTDGVVVTFIIVVTHLGFSLLLVLESRCWIDCLLDANFLP